MASLHLCDADIEAASVALVDLLPDVLLPEADQGGHDKHVGASGELDADGVVIFEREFLQVIIVLCMHLQLLHRCIIVQVVVETTIVSCTYFIHLLRQE